MVEPSISSESQQTEVSAEVHVQIHDGAGHISNDVESLVVDNDDGNGDDHEIDEDDETLRVVLNSRSPSTSPHNGIIFYILKVNNTL